MPSPKHDNLTRDWVRRNQGKLVLGAAGLVLAVGVLWLGSAVTADGAGGTAAKAADVKQRLTADLEAAQKSLTKAHEELLVSLPDANVERVNADTTQARSVVLTIADSSGSNAELAQQQSRLDERFTFWNHTSPALTAFLPAWLENTGRLEQHGTPGTTFQLTSFKAHPVRMDGPDYSYLGVARLDPTESSGSSGSTGKKAEFLIFTFTTGLKGITGFDVYQASAATRDAYLAAEKAAETDWVPDSTASLAPAAPHAHSRARQRGRQHSRQLTTDTTERRRRER